MGSGWGGREEEKGGRWTGRKGGRAGSGENARDEKKKEEVQKFVLTKEKRIVLFCGEERKNYVFIFFKCNFSFT